MLPGKWRKACRHTVVIGTIAAPNTCQGYTQQADDSPMQVAERTQADKKGGHLARRLKDKRLILRESAMCLDEDKAAFEDVSKHCFFNTNNLWVNLDDLKCAPRPLLSAGQSQRSRIPPPAKTVKVSRLSRQGSCSACASSASAMELGARCRGKQGPRGK